MDPQEVKLSRKKVWSGKVEILIVVEGRSRRAVRNDNEKARVI
jgi:hypothetical protein